MTEYDSRTADRAPAQPPTADRTTFEAEVDKLRIREKAHTREGDAIAAARRRLPMVEVPADLGLTGPDGPVTLLEAFESAMSRPGCGATRERAEPPVGHRAHLPGRFTRQTSAAGCPTSRGRSRTAATNAVTTRPNAAITATAVKPLSYACRAAFSTASAIGEGRCATRGCLQL